MHKSKLKLVYIQFQLCVFVPKSVRVKLFAVYILMRVVCAISLLA